LFIVKMLATGALLAGPLTAVDVPVAQADPLVPPTPAEIAYLDHLRRVLAVAPVPEGFNNDGELLDKGRYACDMRDDAGLVGYEATLVPPAVTQLAFIYLCPS
jgi:hypothetical protein